MIRKIMMRIMSIVSCFIILLGAFDYSVIITKAATAYVIDADTDYLSFGTVNQYDRVYYQEVGVFNFNDEAVDLMWYVSDPDGILYVDAPDSMHLEGDSGTTFYVKCDSSVAPGKYSAELYICDRNDSSCIYGSCIRVSITINDVQPYISNVSVAPKNVSLTRNSKVSFSATVNGGNNYSRDVEWSLTGSNGSSSIDNNGVLTIGSNESASSLTIRATSKADRNYYDEATVNISRDQYSITVSAEPSNGGAVSGGGTVNQGDSISLVASPYSGYQFVRWKQNGNEVSRNSKLTINLVNSSASYVAEFKQVNCKLHITSNHSYGGNVSGDVSVGYGGEATITATANPGYKFDGWYENNKKISSDSKYKISNITSDRTITAIFNPNEYTVAAQVSPQDGGTVSGAGKFAQGSTVYLKANPNKGYSFSGWFLNGKEYSKNAEISINNINSDYSFTAYFMKQGTTTYNITSSTATDDGTISPAGNFLVPQGTNVSYTISPKSGYEIADVKVDNVSVGAISSYTFTNVSGKHNIVASFKKKPEANNNQNNQNNQSDHNSSNNQSSQNSQSNNGNGTSNNNGGTQRKEGITDNTQADNGTDYVRPATDYDLDYETGIMQEYNVSDQNVINMIRKGEGREMFEKAIAEGTFELSVYNEMGNYAGVVQQLGSADITITNVDKALAGMLNDNDLLSILHSKKVAISINLFDTTKEVSETDKMYINSNLMEGMKVSNYFDIVILKSVDGDTNEINTLTAPMTLVLNVPDELKGNDYKYYIIRTHTDGDGITTTDILKDEDDNPNTITFSSDKFSTYAIAYKEPRINGEAGVNTNGNAKNQKANDKMTGVSILVGVGVGFVITLVLANVFVAAGRKKKKK